MREILYRAKRKNNGKWEEGFYCPSCFGRFPCRPAIIPKKDMDEGYWHPEEVDPETVGQYTGLTDKNGTKIFEGDIIKSDNGRISAISVVRYGKFEPLMFYDLLEKYVRSRPKEKMYGLFSKSIKGEEMLLSDLPRLKEVIGNIYDNPELLKGE